MTLQEHVKAAAEAAAKDPNWDPNTFILELLNIAIGLVCNNLHTGMSVSEARMQVIRIINELFDLYTMEVKTKH